MAEERQRPLEPEQDDPTAVATLEFLERMNSLEKRNVHLWSVAALVVLLVGVGLFAFLLPDIMWDLGPVEIDGRFLPQLVFAFITLVVVLNIYSLRQHHRLKISRAELVRQLLRAETAEQMSMTDPLTGAYNRRYMDELLTKEIKRADRSGNPLSLLLLDLDNFGMVNKQRGHLEGDRVLREVVSLLNKVFRQTDTVIRYGGDEFLIVLPDTGPDQAEIARKRLLESARTWNELNPLDGLEVRFSCGAATSQKDQSAQDLLAAADSELRLKKPVAASDS